jgi:hypothetical protein
MAPVLEVVAHPTGSWLVKAGDISYAVPPQLGLALRPLAGRIPEVRELRACLAGVRSGPKDDQSAPEIETWVCEISRALKRESSRNCIRAESRQAGRPLRFRVPLVPAGVVGYFAGILKVLAGKRGLTVMALLGGAGYLMAGFLATPAGFGKIEFSWDLGTVAAGLGLFLLSAFWHELGHASALARAGYPPGGVGAGVLFVIPVLFANVTAMGALPRTGRIRVDVSGMIFQLAAGGVFMGLATLRGCPLATVKILTFAGSSALLAISWSLFPFLRSDGYWLICDLLELDDLDRPPSAPISNGLRLFLVGYQTANALFLLIIGVFFPWRMIGLLLGLAQRLGISPDPFSAKWLAAVMVVMFLGVMGIGLTRKIGALLRSAATVARS